MRRSLAALAWGLAACATPAGADVSYDPAEDRGAVETCIAGFETPEALREECRGVVEIPCTHSGEYGGATFELVLCHAREAEAWQAALDVRLTRLAADYPERAALLETAHAAWTAWREAECSYHRADAQGGSAEQVIAAQCQARMTFERVVEVTYWERGGPPY